ncbi:MAG: pyridoxal 5'-phosphate synthase glutaminase subunit PdxT [Dehalobacterium sp.]|jgi:5'-phosphate synthase pdxT subunit
MRVGVLTSKKDFKNHQRMLAQCGMDGVLIVKLPDFDDIDGFILPDDYRASISWKDQDPIKKRIEEIAQQDTPIFGIGNGLVLLAQEVINEGEDYCFGLLDIKMNRYGLNLFSGKYTEIPLKIDVLGKAPFPGIFIEAPTVQSMQPNVGILAMHQEKIVMVRQGNILGSSFHPELADDLRVYLYFKQMIKDAKK